eukprot:1478192-Rhodomonas_salina.1
MGRKAKRQAADGLRVWCAVCNTDLAYAAIGLRACYAIPGTHLAYGDTHTHCAVRYSHSVWARKGETVAGEELEDMRRELLLAGIRLRTSYAKPGTNTAYQPSNPVLAQRISLRALVLTQCIGTSTALYNSRAYALRTRCAVRSTERAHTLVSMRAIRGKGKGKTKGEKEEGERLKAAWDKALEQHMKSQKGKREGGKGGAGGGGRGQQQRPEPVCILFALGTDCAQYCLYWKQTVCGTVCTGDTPCAVLFVLEANCVQYCLYWKRQSM